jgi:hypothetical protein
VTHYGMNQTFVITCSDLYVAYRKAKVDMFYERDHVTAIQFCESEEKLVDRLTALPNRLICELLDPSLVDGRGALRGDHYRKHVVRRLKKHTKKHDPYWNIPLNQTLRQPVIDLPIPEAAPNPASAKSHRELFDFQTTAAPANSGVLFTEQPVPRKRKKGEKD